MVEKFHEDDVSKGTTSLRYYLMGKRYFMALAAWDFAKDQHTGLRKDGVTPEFFHQIGIANYARTMEPSLRHPESTYATIFLHDVVEDSGVSVGEIDRRFGSDVANAVNALSKVVDGKKRSADDVRRMIESDAIASVVKALDRANNQGSMLGVFSVRKQQEYIEETKSFILPIMKIARRRFPDQEPIYENVKHLLIREIRLFEAMHEILRNTEQKLAEASRLPPEPDDDTAEDYVRRLSSVIAVLESVGVENADEVMGVPRGWVTIIEETAKRMHETLSSDPESGVRVRIQQIKEKFGELRFYVGVKADDEHQNLAEKIHDAAAWAEQQSEGRCAVTGKPGRTTNDGWILTLSDEAIKLRATAPKAFSEKMYPDYESVFMSKMASAPEA